MRSCSVGRGIYGRVVQTIFNLLNKRRDPNKYLHSSGASLINALVFCVPRIACTWGSDDF
jgi:hypothetical protein